MKKIFYTLLLLLPVCTGGVFAQTQEPLPDGHFEDWETGTSYRGETYYELSDDFWSSLNMLSTLPPNLFTGPVTLFRDNGRNHSEDPYDFCPRMESNQLPYADGEIIFLPGVIGSFEVDVEGLTAYFGHPFTSRPKAIKGYMKYQPVNGDSASIFVEVYKWNSFLGTRTMIGRVEKHYYTPIENWTEFNLPLVYNSDETPDSISVLFVSSAGYNFNDLFHCYGQVGSTLWVDDVEFVYGDGPAANENNALRTSALMPNPSATGKFNLKVAEDCRVEVVSLTGRTVLVRDVKAGSYMLDLGDAAKGMYLVRLTNSRGSAVLKAVRQ